jgi:putative transposase
MAIQTDHPDLSVTRRCLLLGLSRSSRYYASTRDTSSDERVMRMIDRQYTDTPFYGVRRMAAWLRRQAIRVNAKRVRRLMRLMGLEAIYQKPRLSLQNKANPAYPYLLKGLGIDKPDQVWCADITYLPMRKGWAYLAAIMDWFSRYVVAWDLSVTLDAGFCVALLKQSLSMGTPGIFNTDQGSQFTSQAFTATLMEAGVSISMDGARRAYDNIFIERLWRSVKYEEVYLHDYQTPTEAYTHLRCYFEFYNHRRLHQALDYRTPAEVYGLPPRRTKTRAGKIPSLAAAPVGLRPPSAAASGAASVSPP